MSVTASSSATAQAVRGSIVPRLWTRPLVDGPPGPCGCGCALTPETSWGFAVISWATDVLHFPPDPWQCWALIHGLELLPDGRPRFRILLIEVARQNGKTTLLVILSLWWQFVCAVRLILGTSTKLDYAKESWHLSIEIAEAAPALARYRGRRWTREANGEQVSWTTEKSRYKIAPSNAKGGRSLTVHRLILDELREHHDYSAWGASVNAGNAVRHFQAWALTNAGDDQSIVLNDLHDACETFIDWWDVQAAAGRPALEDAPGDYRQGMFSWSCTIDMDPLNPEHLAIANPNLGWRNDVDALLGEARKMVRLGGAALASFQTESMCIRVLSLNPAIDMGAWRTCAVPGPLDLDAGVVACLDIAPDLQHATLCVGQGDDVTRVEVVASWDSLEQVRRDLPDWLERVRPYAFGWFPGTAAEALHAELSDPRKGNPTRAVGRRGWPPRGVRMTEIKTEAAAACMGLAALIAEGPSKIVHSDAGDDSGQRLLTDHLGNAEKRAKGEGGAWIFDRRPGAGHIDAAYALAGVVHLARTMPPPRRGTALRVAR